MALVACPFCREMFPKDERAACPVCGVALVALEKLPPSPDRASEDGLPLDPAHEALPALYLGRGRGLLPVLALAGLVCFFSPWIKTTLPDIRIYTGFDLARRLGWAWAVAAAWFVVVPTVLSRRTIMQMRGARVAASFLAAVPGMTAAVLLARPPHASHGVPLRFTYEAGLYATLLVSLAALVTGAVLGGRVDDIRVRHGSSRGETVH